MRVASFLWYNRESLSRKKCRNVDSPGRVGCLTHWSMLGRALLRLVELVHSFFFCYHGDKGLLMLFCLVLFFSFLSSQLYVLICTIRTTLRHSPTFPHSHDAKGTFPHGYLRREPLPSPATGNRCEPGCLGLHTTHGWLEGGLLV